MDTYINDESVNTISLDHQAGAVLSLECSYKEGIEGTVHQIGRTDTYFVGQTISLKLREFASSDGLKDGCWITAYANVKAAKNSQGTVWVKYSSNSNNTANYIISGVLNDTEIVYSSVTKNE